MRRRAAQEPPATEPADEVEDRGEYGRRDPFYLVMLAEEMTQVISYAARWADEQDRDAFTPIADTLEVVGWLLGDASALLEGLEKASKAKSK